MNVKIMPQFKKADHQIGAKACPAQSHWLTGVTNQLFQLAAVLFPHDRKRSQECCHVQQQNRRQSRQEKLGERESGLNSNLGRMSTANVSLFTSTRRNDSSSPIERGHIDGLARHRRIGAINQHQNLRTHLMQQFIRVNRRESLMPTRALPAIIISFIFMVPYSHNAQDEMCLSFSGGPAVRGSRGGHSALNTTVLICRMLVSMP